MQSKEETIKALQMIVTALSQQADGHAIQSRIFESEGFPKLAEKYAGHAAEERGNVEKFIDRILDLGGEVKNEAKQEMPVCTDPVEWVKCDLEVSRKGLELLGPMVEAVRDDYTTYDLLKAYYEDEEEDMYWGETQLELIDRIGVQNWLVSQL